MSKTTMYLAVAGVAVAGVGLVYYLHNKAAHPSTAGTSGSVDAAGKARTGQPGHSSNAFDLGIALVTSGANVYDAYSRSNTSPAAVGKS